MLATLTIHDIVLIERLDIGFAPGLCALTGETGAGKSILLDSLGLALGARSEAGLVRRGADHGSVTAHFELPPVHPAWTLLAEQEIDAEDEIVLRRTLSADGKSRAFVNDIPVTIGTLRRIGRTLVEIQSEREQISLLDPATHRAMLDIFGGLSAAAADVRLCHADWHAAEEAVTRARRQQEDARRNEEHYRYAADELARLDPRSGEESALAKRRSQLMHGQKIAEAIERAQAALGGERSVTDRLQAAQAALAAVAALAGSVLDEPLSALERAAIEAGDAESALARASERLDIDPAHLEKAEERLFALRALARKHGVSVDTLPDLRDRFEQELLDLERSSLSLQALVKTATERAAAFKAAGKKLSAARAKAARALEAAVAKELPPLKLGAARFAVGLEPTGEDGAGVHGFEEVRFRVAFNPGETEAPLEKVASGGELSRLLLALKVVSTGTGSVSTLVFDEIDQGIGGATAQAVGERLARLASGVQVLVVTHSPQVAARASHHFRVSKNTTKKTALTVLDRLEFEARREEIARMLAGQTITDEARAAAERLLEGSGP